MAGGGKKKKVTVGYKYYVGMHMVFCETPDAILQINVGERTLWTGNITQTTRSLYVDKPDLFGGERREGGVVGNIDIDFGEPTQSVNPYLQSKLPNSENGVPAFRGVLSLILRQVYVSAMTPYLKKWDVKVKRIPAKGWYDEKAEINGHANPAHILYEIITENSIGEIDDRSFKSAADTLYDEKFGLSFIWKGGSIQSFIEDVVNHIGGVLYVDPTTGKFYLKLIRKNYNIEDLPVFDETNIVSLESYQKRTLSDTINQITINYIDGDTGKECSVTLQDLANIQAQGQVVEDKRDYVGIPNYSLAYQIAQRDLVAGSALLSKIVLKVNRTAFNITPGDVFVFKWDNLGINRMICRVLEVNYGTLQDNIITIKAIEDVFSFSDAIFTEIQSSYWEDPVKDPTPCPVSRIDEAPYWDVKRAVDDANFEYILQDGGFVVTLGVKPSNIAFNYELQIDDGGGYSSVGTFTFAPACSLVNDISETDTIIDFEEIADMNLAEAGDTVYAWLGDEAVRIDNIDLVNRKLTIGRGCLDTVPTKHNAGEIIIFAGLNWYGYSLTEYTADQTINAKLLPTTGKGTLDPEQAPELKITLNSRLNRPYPPAHLTINGELYPKYIVGPLSFAWFHRDKTQQDAILIDDSMGNIGPEPGTTYSFEIKRANTNEILYSETGILDNNKTLENVNFDGDIVLELWSVLNNYESWQRQKREFTYFRQNPIITETEEIITSETGQYFIVEG